MTKSQLGLYDGTGSRLSGMVRTDDQDTAVEAAKQVSKGATRIRENVYKLFLEHGPMNDYDLEQLYYKTFEVRPYSTVRKRRCELRDAGLVRDSGRRSTNPTGSTMIVWEAIP